MADEGLLRRAADLFNRKHYFECHELLEDEWQGARGEEKVFLQGLILIAVGMYHIANANFKGAVNVLEKARARLEPFLPERDGLDLEALIGVSGRALDKARHALGGEGVVWTAEDVPGMSFRDCSRED